MAPAPGPLGDPVLLRVPERSGSPAMHCRAGGDRYLLVEFGPEVLDFDLRFRVHALMLWLETRAVPGVIDLTKQADDTPGDAAVVTPSKEKLLPIDAVTARIWGEESRWLRREGAMIGVNDLWIAALALRHGMPVLTANASEFERVRGLRVVTY